MLTFRKTSNSAKRSAATTSSDIPAVSDVANVLKWYVRQVILAAPSSPALTVSTPMPSSFQPPSLSDQARQAGTPTPEFHSVVPRWSGRGVVVWMLDVGQKYSQDGLPVVDLYTLSGETGFMTD